MLTDVGPVEVKGPRDVAGTFEPASVEKRQRRLSGVDEMVLSLSAKGLTHGEISAPLTEVCGANVSKATISTITDKVMDGMAEGRSSPREDALRAGAHPRATANRCSGPVRSRRKAAVVQYGCGDTVSRAGGGRRGGRSPRGAGAGSGPADRRPRRRRRC